MHVLHLRKSIPFQIYFCTLILAFFTYLVNEKERFSERKPLFLTTFDAILDHEQNFFKSIPF